MQKSNKLFLFIFFSILSITHIAAQDTPKILQNDNEVIKDICKEISPNGWLYFKDDSKIEASSFFTNYRDALGLDTKSEMVLLHQEIDELEMRHSTYQQYYKGIKVEDAIYTLHEKGCNLELAHGNLVEGLEFDTEKTITEKEALQAALKAVGAEKYAWQDEAMEKALKEDSEDEKATYYPKGELLLTALQDSNKFSKDNYRLSYRFEVTVISPKMETIIYIDALSDTLLRSQSPVKYQCEPITSNATRYVVNSGQTIFFSSEKRKNDVILYNCQRGIHTKSDPDVTWWGTGANVSNTNQNWGTSSQEATNCQWATDRVWTMYVLNYGRTGFNTWGAPIRVYSSASQETGYRERFGKYYLDIQAGLGTLDVVGHEFTHGVIAFSSHLDNSGEAQSIEESFGDIFGEIVEIFVDGKTDWVQGTNLSSPYKVRDLRTTTVNWYKGAAYNNAAYHDKGGIQNICFTRLVFGWNLSNTIKLPNGKNIVVKPISTEAAGKIAYRNMVRYVKGAATFASTREGSIRAATELFGACSFEVAQVKNAWASVGVGEENDKLCVEIKGKNNVCAKSFSLPLVLQGTISTGNQIGQWTVPPNWDYVINGNTITITFIPSSFFNILNPSSYYDDYYVKFYTTIEGTEVVDRFYFLCDNTKPCSPSKIVGKQEQQAITNRQYKNKSETILDDNESIKIYPNPTNEGFVIDLEDYTNTCAILYNSLGQFVEEKKLTQPSTYFESSNINSGMYFMHIKKADETKIFKISILK